ncbi:M24 family metallopeptidase [Donghicola sp. XS_ASV15]|uniref:M24 family metallopeptidase n=1 Tax=Donghicola sp. XS_ASV15 TaxID=3241295 RepID=UPI003519492D
MTGTLSDRLADYSAVARSLGVDAVALVPGPNFTRVVHHPFMSNERPFVLAACADGRAAAIVPNLELQSWELVGFDGPVFDWRDQTGYAEAFAGFMDYLNADSIAVEGQVMRVFIHHAMTAARAGVQIVDAEREISALRMIKTPEDIEAMRTAIQISERALERTLETIQMGHTEKQIEQALVLNLFAEGASDHAFRPIVAAAENSARPHAEARDVPIKSGDALLFDFGARWGGFCADITRTFFVGHVADEDAELYDTVRRANNRGHEIARGGVTAHEIDDAVTGVLETSPFAEYIRTKTGHGLGREVHEAPYIMRGNHMTLPAGTVFTNEPGLYVPGRLGVRIEDDVLITDAGSTSLTTFPTELRVLEC